MDAKIKHHGVVESVEPGCVHVRIRQSDGCAACRVASHCHSAEAQDKIIDVGDSSGRYHAGDSVVILADRSVGFTAGLYAYVLPLALMMAALVAVRLLTGSDGWAALSALGVLAPYYLAVWLLRGKINRHVTFELEKSPL